MAELKHQRIEDVRILPKVAKTSTCIEMKTACNLCKYNINYLTELKHQKLKDVKIVQGVVKISISKYS